MSTIFDAYKDMWRRYDQFEGRTTRKGFWFAFLVNMAIRILALLLGLLAIVIDSRVFFIVILIAASAYELVLIIPQLALGVRRLHDTDRSAWMLFVAFIPSIVALVLRVSGLLPSSTRLVLSALGLISAIVLIVFYATAGTLGDNRYGPAPSWGEFSSAGRKLGLFPRIAITILCLMWFIPVFGTFLTSFRPYDDVNSSGWWQVFTKPAYITHLTLANYDKALFGSDAMGTAFLNSLAITLPATFIPILVAAFAAYAFTFMEFRGRNTLFLVVVSLLVIPNYVALVPMLKVYNWAGISGSFAAVWLAHIGFGMSLAVYILRNYMATLPRSVIESARIDGAGHYQIFYRLVLPMSSPALASFAIFQFLWVWNDLLVALVFVDPGEDHQPLTIALKKLTSGFGFGWELTTAGGFFTMLMPIIVFLSLQRYFVRGLTAGAVKG